MAPEKPLAQGASVLKPLGPPLIVSQIVVQFSVPDVGKFKHSSILNFRFRNTELKPQFD